MPEQYTGPKFKTVFLEKKLLEDERIKEIIKISKKFGELGFYPKYKGGSAGNSSFRTEKGFIITASYTNKANLKPGDFTEVLHCDREKKEVYVKGYKEPSSESFLHFSIYQKRQDVNSIFHGHSEIISKLNLKKTEKPQPYGSLELVDEVMKALNNHNLIIMHDHGFLSLGKTIEEANNQVLEKIKELSG